MTRSWWAWGTDDEALTAGEVTKLIDRARLLAPDHDFTDHPPPDPESLPLAPPRVTPPGGARAPVLDRRHRPGRPHLRQGVPRRRAQPPGPARPRARPRRSAAHRAATSSRCSTGAPPTVSSAIPYGGGSSVVGGIEPRFDGPAVTIDLGHLDQVLEIDRTSRAGAHPGRRARAPPRGPAPPARPHPAPLPPVVRATPRWAAGSPPAPAATSRRSHTHIDDLTESLRAVTPSGTMRVATPPRLGRRPVPRPPVPGLRGHARHHHRGLDAPAGPTALAGHRVGDVRRLRHGCRRHPSHRPGRAVPRQLPPARRRAKRS